MITMMSIRFLSSNTLCSFISMVLTRSIPSLPQIHLSLSEFCSCNSPTEWSHLSIAPLALCIRDHWLVAAESFLKEKVIYGGLTNWKVTSFLLKTTVTAVRWSRSETNDECKNKEKPPSAPTHLCSISTVYRCFKLSQNSVSSSIQSAR